MDALDFFGRNPVIPVWNIGKCANFCKKVAFSVIWRSCVKQGGKFCANRALQF
jgi:hypothetical protein